MFAPDQPLRPRRGLPQMPPPTQRGLPHIFTTPNGAILEQAPGHSAYRVGYAPVRGLARGNAASQVMPPMPAAPAPRQPAASHPAMVAPQNAGLPGAGFTQAGPLPPGAGYRLAPQLITQLLDAFAAALGGSPAQPHQRPF